MTRKVALHCMKSYSELHSDLCELCPIYGQTGSDHCFEDALQYVIGMLEQEPVIDKLRAEIGKSKTEHEMQLAENDLNGKLLVSHIYCGIVSILDKYKAENEVKK